jgi:hypothetical protein
MKWARHVALMGKRRVVYRDFWRNSRERDHLENTCIYGRIILRWIFKYWDVGAWTGLMWLRIGTGVGHL